RPRSRQRSLSCRAPPRRPRAGGRDRCPRRRGGRNCRSASSRPRGSASPPRRTDQADERAAGEFRGGAIVETPAMSLQRLPLRLLADLRPIDLGALALLLCHRKAFGADRAHQSEIIANAEILEI